MKSRYFREGKPDKDDIHLEMAKGQGYVPKTCLLGGQLVMALVNSGENPCTGCNCPREKCHGRPKRAKCVG